MSTASNPMGLKRICTGCGTRFYDLNKRPIICPSCDTEFTGEVKAKARRGRSAAVEPKIEDIKKAVIVENDDEDILEDDDGVEVVSLDDLDESKNDDDEKVEDDDESGLDDIPEFDGDLDDDDTLLDDDED